MVDGFAIRLRGEWTEGAEFRVVGSIAAGEAWPRRLAPGTALRIMTGAPAPPGTDGVVMIERAQASGEDRVRLSGPFETSGRGKSGGSRPGLAARGEDARRGAVVLARGGLIEAPQIAVLAAVGRTMVPVFRKLRVAILTTGNETVPASRQPSPSRIRDSNGPLLAALLERTAAAEVVLKASIRDALGPMRLAVRRAAARADALLLTGGVSAGDYDLVPEALVREGFRIRFHRVALRPGKPLLFATNGPAHSRRVAFGLPGNPVSVLATAWEFVIPYLHAAAGWQEPGPMELRARAAETIVRAPGLTHFVPGALEMARDGILEARSVPSHGSGDFVSASRAHCLVVLPAENPRVEVGDECRVHPLASAFGGGFFRIA